MRNRIITVILLVSILLLVFFMFVGFEKGKIHILSLSQLKEKNNQLEEKIEQASRLTSTDYPDNIKTLEKTYEKYSITKQKYEELSGFTTEKNKKDVYETKKYDIGYLWKLVGKYAKTYNIGISMNVEKNGGQEGLYNLNFSVSGQYVNISEFISKIENNSDLYFRIYNFKMSGSGETVTATFTVKDVNIDSSTLKTNSSLDKANGTSGITETIY